MILTFSAAIHTTSVMSSSSFLSKSLVFFHSPSQFSASMKALEHAGYKFFAATMEQCVRDPERAAEEGYSAAPLEKLFLQLTSADPFGSTDLPRGVLGSLTSRQEHLSMEPTAHLQL